MAKYAARVHVVRHSPGHLRDKLAAHRIFAMSVLQFFCQFASPPPALALRESAALASTLASPMRAVTRLGVWGLGGCGSACHMVPGTVLLELSGLP